MRRKIIFLVVFILGLATGWGLGCLAEFLSKI